jgi:hypothetical protein
LAGQLRVSEDLIMESTRCIDDTHALVVNYCWKELMAHDSSNGGFSMDEFHTLGERMTMTRANYQHFFIDIDYLLEIGEMYHRALRE